MISQLIKGKSLYFFIVCKIRKENEFQYIESKPLVIFEGIMALYEERFRALMDLKIFVLTDDDIRLLRRIKRDIHERGRTIQDVLF
jgi:uridine kinase